VGRNYEELSLDDRCEIASFKPRDDQPADRCSLDRAPSTISREIGRNRGKIAYKASFAQEQTQARRWTGSRQELEFVLRRAVKERLARGGRPSRSPAGWRVRPAAR
jgi:IS30 family transposase